MEFLDKIKDYCILHKWIVPVVISAIFIFAFRKKIAAKLLEMRTKKEDPKTATPTLGGARGTTLTSAIKGGQNIMAFSN
jgi:hypothetical protein